MCRVDSELSRVCLEKVRRVGEPGITARLSLCPYSPECVEGKFSEVPRLRELRGFAKMPGREAGPRIWRGEIKPRAESSFISHGYPTVSVLEGMDFPRPPEWGRSSATLPHSPLHAGIRTHSLCENMVNLG